MDNTSIANSSFDSSISLLNKSASVEVQTVPFPHIVIKNALDDDFYQQLSCNYPETDLIRNSTKVSNRHQIQAKEALAHDSIHPLWKQFINYHTSRAFYLELLQLFSPHIQAAYPWLENSVGKLLPDFSCGIRDSEASHLPDVCIDCQPGLNTVSKERSTVRTPHLDARNKLLTGLFYMKHADDMSEGGDLELYKFTSKKPLFTKPSTPDRNHVTVAATVPYQQNTALFFMNSPASVHGVSPRDATEIPRRLVNLIVGMYTLKEKELFPEPESPASGILSRIFNRA